MNKKEIVTWFLQDLLQGSDFSKFDTHIHEEYSSMEDDLPYWIKKGGGTFFLGGENLELVSQKHGRDAFRERMENYLQIYGRAKLNHTLMAEENDIVMCYAHYDFEIDNGEMFPINAMYVFNFIETEAGVQIKSIFYTSDFLAQLIDHDIFELNAAQNVFAHEYVTYLKKMGLVNI